MAAAVEGKLFVGGVAFGTSEAALCAHFGRYGELADCFLMMDKATGRPRGFAFVQYADADVARVVAEETHVIDGRQVDVRVAVPKDTAARVAAAPGSPPAASLARSNKIFVGGLSPATTEEAFRAHFSPFGTIADAVVMVEPASRRPRGFGFVTFTEEEAVERVFAAGALQDLGGKRIEVKRAVPREELPPPAPRGGGASAVVAGSAAAGGRGAMGAPRAGRGRGRDAAAEDAYAAAAVAAAAAQLGPHMHHAMHHHHHHAGVGVHPAAAYAQLQAMMAAAAASATGMYGSSPGGHHPGMFGTPYLGHHDGRVDGDTHWIAPPAGLHGGWGAGSEAHTSRGAQGGYHLGPYAADVAHREQEQAAQYAAAAAYAAGLPPRHALSASASSFGYAAAGAHAHHMMPPPSPPHHYGYAPLPVPVYAMPPNGVAAAAAAESPAADAVYEAAAAPAAPSAGSGGSVHDGSSRSGSGHGGSLYGSSPQQGGGSAGGSSRISRSSSATGGSSGALSAAAEAAVAAVAAAAASMAAGASGDDGSSGNNNSSGGGGSGGFPGSLSGLRAALVATAPYA